MKIRGSASQIFEKYQALARDASSSGDYIAAENFYQHAEHYFRVLAANAAANGGASAQAANGAGREAQNPSADGGRQSQAAQGQNGGGRGNGRGRRNVGSVRPNGESKTPPQDPGAGPQPVVPAPDGDQPQPPQQSHETPGT